MRWIVDTSAWSRLHRPEIQKQVEELLGDENELVLSPAVELEVLRADAETFSLAADAMECLARHQAEAHRRPIADLITAAVAHQHGCGVLHLDGDFELLAEHGGLAFDVVRVKLREPDGDDEQAADPAAKQRQLETELAELLHQMPLDEAETFLGAVIDQARARVGAARS